MNQSSIRFRFPFLHSCSLAVLASLLTAASLLGAVESEVGKAFAAFDSTKISDRSTKAMAIAADAFLEDLPELPLAKGKLPFNTPEKTVWSNLPPNMSYAGIRIADLNEAELDRLLKLLATSLSLAGFEKVRGIMLGDDLLVRGDQTGNRMLFGADNYWFFIYGDPSSGKPWGWQFDGHHLAINLTITDDSLTLSPSFIGTQPADVKWGTRYTHAPMENEVDRAFTLVNSLTGEQRSKAVVGDRRQNLDAGPGDDHVTPPTQGIPGKELTTTQRNALGDVISQWLEILPTAYANKRMAEITPTLSETHFGWWGSTKVGNPVYFRIQGPEVLIEFANQNLGGNPLQHLHSVYRDPSNDYGKTF